MTIPTFRHILPLIAAGLLCGCGGLLPSGSGTPHLRIVGSDTMLPVTTRWGYEFKVMNPDIDVTILGGGTRAGIEALINGNADIAAASSQLNPDELRRLLRKERTLTNVVLTAKDALCVYVHPTNPVRSLTLDQLRMIFTGRIRNWNEVGGAARTITLRIREETSGTYWFFLDHVLNGEAYAADAQHYIESRSLIQAIAADSGSIGYGGMAYENGRMHIAVEGIEPAHETVTSNDYPLARYLYLILTREPKGIEKDFIDFVLSAAGQEIVREVGYVPLVSP